MPNVTLVTSLRPHCGIHEYALQLQKATQAANPSVLITLAEDPPPMDSSIDLLHLNHQGATAPGWSAERVAQYQAHGLPVVVTLHDTFGEHSPEEMRAKGDSRLNLAEALYKQADATIVHEPCKGFEEALVWRQGIPSHREANQFGLRSYYSNATSPLENFCFLDYVFQPVLGSVGFPAPHKNYAALAQITADAGWALLLIAPGATDEQISSWQQINPCLSVWRDFPPSSQVVSLLAACDASAFFYTAAFAGISGAIRWGIAARKPVLAYGGQRQFRDLWGEEAITWVEGFDDLARRLKEVPLTGRPSAAMIELAHRDRWSLRGQQHADLYTQLLAERA